MKTKTAKEYIDWIDEQSGEYWSTDTEMIAQIMEDYAKMKTDTVNGWFLFKEFMPELSQEIEIYWSSDERTKQVWRDDISWMGDEIPRFWRVCR